jgi:hypothetical protein
VEITLTDGRVWEGVIVRENADAIVLDTVGGEIEISRKAVAKIDRKPTRREIYRDKLDKMDKTDPNRQYLLALWARRNGLLREAEYHLNYAIGLDPDHEGARLALGHVRHEGKWMPEEEAKEAQGLRFYGGRWMTKEAAALAETEDLKKELKGEVERRVRALADAIATARTEETRYRAVRELMSFRDPFGADAVLKLMNHDSADVREVAIRAVDRLKLSNADARILSLALRDADAFVRDRARKTIEHDWKEWMLAEVLAALSSGDPPAVRFSAALLLGVVKDVNAVEPLIDALYVAYRARTPETPPPTLGLTGLSVRDSAPGAGAGAGPVIYDPVAGPVGAGPGAAWRPLDAPDDDRFAYLVNYAALDALRAITGRDFGVNKRAWRQWWLEAGDDFRIWKEVEVK